MGLELLLLHIDVLEWINPRTATEEEMVITRFGTHDDADRWELKRKVNSVAKAKFQFNANRS